jgi:Flp pilus assembly pilin Flp
MTSLIRRFIRDEAGQDIIEYALLAAFISIAAIASVIAIGGQVQVYFGNVQTALK